jgi:HPt (histidine-containing phosphotransfer) domain-containing protein/two-component sensor histidine kinase
VKPVPRASSPVPGSPSRGLQLRRYLALPAEISSFERTYLARMNRIGLAFFLLHVPAMALIALINDIGPWFTLGLTLATIAGPVFAYRVLENPRTISVVYGIAAMIMGGVLVHIGQGIVQIEMHFYFFALLAMLAVFGNPRVIVTAALTVTAHHLGLWLLLPASVFNYDAPMWVVAVHAAFVVLESIAGCFIARSFFDNVIGLERIVLARTTDLDAANRDMRLVLDHVAHGLATIDRDGVLSDQRSRAFDDWFGDPRPEQTIFDLLARSSAEFAEASCVAWDEVVGGVMPLELTLAQMPASFETADAHYRVEYRAIGDGLAPERFLVVVTDDTAELAHEAADRELREAMHLFECYVADRQAVYDFFDEASRLVEHIGDRALRSVPAFARTIHTLKGNASIFGLQSLVIETHRLETLAAEEGRLPTSRELIPLVDRWTALASEVARLVGPQRPVIEIDEKDHAALEAAVRQGERRCELLRRVHAFKLEPTQRRLEHFGAQARRIGIRLDKDVQVVVDGHGLRVDPKYWGPFWNALIHAVRNAIDHGLESPQQRIAVGKPPQGTIALQTRLQEGRLVVEVRDDGQGIDWDRIAQRATERGLPSDTRSELLTALFGGGITTAERVSDFSGRGLGLSALHAATEGLDGRVEVESRRGTGTTIRMIFPGRTMSPDLVMLAG